MAKYPFNYYKDFKQNISIKTLTVKSAWSSGLAQ